MHLAPDTIEQLKRVTALIDLKELELAALKSHLASLLKEATGVDTHEGEWVLDLESGELYGG